MKDIFKGESDKKIRKYSNIMASLDIRQADHLPLALDKILSCPEITSIDKEKIKKYAKSKS